MLTKIKARFRRFFSRWIRNPFMGIKLPPITDNDLNFEYRIRRIFRDRVTGDASDQRFISYMTLEDYTKDFIVFYKSNRESFRLDYSQRDGHFRV
jgi:hypothetical protein